MKVFQILAAGYLLGVIVNKDGSLDEAGALNAWNEDAGPNYQGDTAKPVNFYEA